MPMPKPKPGEGKQDFLDRCMANPTMGDEYPDNDQRFAVCNQLWRDKEMPVNQRAYSILTVKAVEENGKRIIRGTATTPTVDRVGDIIEPLGVKYTNPMPFLWQHNSEQPIGLASFKRPTAAGVEFEAELPTIDEPGTLRDRIDEAWQSMKAGLVRAVSIGFRAIEYAFMESGGIHFTEVEVYELSAVTIPANADATIAAIKKFDVGAPAAPGRPAPPNKSLPASRGKSHSVDIRPKEGTEMKTVREQITALEASRQAKSARMAEVMQKSIDEGRSTDQAEQEEFDTLQSEVDAIDGDLKRLKSLEASQARAAASVDPGIKTIEDGTAARVPAQVKVNRQLPPGIRFARVVKCLGMARGNYMQAELIGKQLYQEDEAVVNILKAAVAAGTVSGATWAGPLVGDETGVFADFIEFLRPQTIIGRFGANGIPALRRVPFRVALVGQTSGGAGYWVGEGKAKPLTKFDFTRTTLEPLKVANIAVLTEEVLRDSSPSAEAIIRDELVNALRARLDTDFIDPAKAASAGVSPASITNGAGTIVSTGDTADDVRVDVRALFQLFINANNPPTSGVWMMSSSTALALSLMVNALDQAEFPGINMNGGTFFGLPVLVSDYIGDIVALVNANDIYLADEGGFAVDMSREASLEMSDTPAGDSGAPTASSVALVSLWQTNSVGFRAERTINWARRRTQSVAYLTGVGWGGAVPAS